MQKLLIRFIIIVLAVILTACAVGTSSRTGGLSSPDLNEILVKLEEVSSRSIKDKRRAAVIIYENWAFDGGFWEDQLKKANISVDLKLRDAIEQLNKLTKKWRNNPPPTDPISFEVDQEYGKTVSCWLYIVGKLIQHKINEVLPQIARILSVL